MAITGDMIESQAEATGGLPSPEAMRAHTIRLSGSTSYGPASRFLAAYTNPSSMMIRQRARRSATAANSLYNVNDPSFWDWLDEANRMVWPLSTALKLITSNVLERHRSVVLDDKNTDPAALALRDFIEAEIDVFISKVLRMQTNYSYLHGISWMEIVWNLRDNGRYGLEAIDHCHPGLIAFRGQTPVYYGTPFVSEGGALGEADMPLPMYKFIMTRQEAPYGNPYGESGVIGIEQLVFLYIKTMHRLAGVVDANGLPIAVVKIKDNGLFSDGKGGLTTEQISQLRTVLETLSENGGGIVLPNFVESLEWQDRKGGETIDAHIRVLDFCNKEITRYVYGSLLGTTDSEHGSRAQASVHTSTSDTYTRPLAQIVEDSINRDLIRPLIALNWIGPNPPDIKFSIDLDDPASLDEVQKRIELAAKYELGLTVRQAARDLDINPAKPGEEIVTEPVDAAAAGAGAVTPEGVKLPEIYGYHLDAGVLSPNEVRKRLGFPPVAGGDVLMTPAAKPESPAPFADDLSIQPGEPAEPAEPVDPLKFKTYGQLSEAHGVGKSTIKTVIRKAIAAGTPVRMLGFKPHEGDFLAALKSQIKGGPVEETEDESEDSEGGQGESELFAEIDPGAMASERQIRELLFAIADAAAKDIQPTFKSQVSRAVSKVAKTGEPDADVEPDYPPSFTDALIASAMLANLSIQRGVLDRIDGEPLDAEGETFSVKSFAEEIPNPVQRAVDWLESRGIGSPADLRAMIKAIRAAGKSPEFARQAEKYARDRVLILKKITGETATNSVNEWLARGTAEGKPLQAMLEEARAGIADGTFQPASDAYMENIARTETASAMSKQQRRIEKENPIVRRALAGHIYSNAADSRSRPSHAALDGEFFEAGSPESEALGFPPYSYQCRCNMIPVLRISGQPVPTQKPGLMSKVRQIERFAEGGIKCQCGA